MVCCTVRGWRTEEETAFKIYKDLCMWYGIQRVQMVAMCDHKTGERPENLERLHNIAF